MPQSASSGQALMLLWSAVHTFRAVQDLLFLMQSCIFKLLHWLHMKSVFLS
jgi:hypothetical protein